MIVFGGITLLDFTTGYLTRCHENMCESLTLYDPGMCAQEALCVETQLITQQIV